MEAYVALHQADELQAIINEIKVVHHVTIDIPCSWLNNILTSHSQGSLVQQAEKIPRKISHYKMP
jgi:hypothetical protein